MDSFCFYYAPYIASPFEWYLTCRRLRRKTWRVNLKWTKTSFVTLLFMVHGYLWWHLLLSAMCWCADGWWAVLSSVPYAHYWLLTADFFCQDWRCSILPHHHPTMIPTDRHDLVTLLRSFPARGVPAYVSRGSVIRLLEAMMDRYTKNVKPFMFTNSADRRPKLWRRWISSLRFCLTNSSFCPFFGYKWMMNDRANFTDDVATNRSLNAVLIWSPRRLLTAEKNLDEKCYS